MTTQTVLRSLILVAAVIGAGAPSAGAQDRDEFYAIARGESGRRPAAAQPRSYGFPGFSLFGGGGSRRDLPEITVRPNGPPANATPRRVEGRTPTGENVSGPRAYCVRTCDGFFFPAGPALSGDGRRAQQMTCNSLCPGAEVALYTIASQGSIEDAVGPRGQTYSALRTAFRFRQSVDRTCSCQSVATNGLARLPITHDFTLRAGDVVVTDQGVRVFRGAARFPYRNQDFVEARTYGRLPADIRRRVVEIQAGIQARDSGASAPVARTSGRLGAIVPASTAPATAAAPAGEQTPVATAATPVRVLDITRRPTATSLQ
jgi:hypothetical protein